MCGIRSLLSETSLEGRKADKSHVIERATPASDERKSATEHIHVTCVVVETESHHVPTRYPDNAVEDNLDLAYRKHHLLSR